MMHAPSRAASPSLLADPLSFVAGKFWRFTRRYHACVMSLRSLKRFFLRSEVLLRRKHKQTPDRPSLQQRGCTSSRALHKLWPRSAVSQHMLARQRPAVGSARDSGTSRSLTSRYLRGRLHRARRRPVIATQMVVAVPQWVTTPASNLRCRGQVPARRLDSGGSGRFSVSARTKSPD
jgi:hypothetical protein